MLLESSVSAAPETREISGGLPDGPLRRKLQKFVGDRKGKKIAHARRSREENLRVSRGDVSRGIEARGMDA